jgi:transposase
MLCGMKKILLSPEKINELRRAHRLAKDKTHADRIKSVYLWSQGMSAEEIANVLMIDEDTVRNNRKRYEKEGVSGLLKDNYHGSESYLSVPELEELAVYLEETTHLTVESIVDYVKKTYEIEYSISGMRQLLHRLDFVYKKAKSVPSKADATEQAAYLEMLKEILEKKSEKDPHYYLDGVHPQHNTQLAYGWIKKGQDKLINANSGRSRLNMNGALNSATLEVVMRVDETINAQSTLALFKTLEEKHPEASHIYVTLDNARYYKNKIIGEYIETSKIRLLFLPAYSPNINLIERLWKFMRKEVLYNKYYEKFKDFKNAILGFFENIADHKMKLTTLLTKNFKLLNGV